MLGGDVFLHAVHTFRNVWLMGRYGGGKTLLSVVIAEKLREKYGYSIYANIPVHIEGVIDRPVLCSGDTRCCDSSCEDNPKFHTVVIYDESWLTLGAGTSHKEVRRYLAFLRKVDYILLMPSVLDLARSSYLLWCERFMNLGPLGIPVWGYKWGVAGQSMKRSGGRFWLGMPQSYFGTYDTHAQPDELGHLFEDESIGRGSEEYGYEAFG